MLSWRNWITHLTTNQKIESPTLSGGTKILNMKIKKIGWFLNLFPVGAITLAPFGIYVDKTFIEYSKHPNLVGIYNRIINHEKIHWKQQLEMLIIFFYLWYVIEWLIKLIKYGKAAYNNISFERESYANEENFKYLETRKHFAWLKHIIKK